MLTNVILLLIRELFDNAENKTHHMICEQNVWNMTRFIDFFKPSYTDMVSTSLCAFNKFLNSIIRREVTMCYGLFCFKIGILGICIDGYSNEESSY